MNFRSLLSWFRKPSANPSGEDQDLPWNSTFATKRTNLASTQAEVAEALENAFLDFDTRSQKLAARINQLSPEVFSQEFSQLQEEQRQLRHALLRFQTIFRPSSDLVEELDQWSTRETDEDEARRRAEIVRSELAWRGDLNVSEEALESSPAEDTADRAEYSEPEQASVQLILHHIDRELIPDEAHLLAAIREAVRETERWHGVSISSNESDAVVQARHLKDLHAILKRLDRARHIRRDRTEFAPRFRID